MSINVELFEMISKRTVIEVKSGSGQVGARYSDQNSKAMYIDPSIKEFHDKVDALKRGQIVLMGR